MSNDIITDINLGDYNEDGIDTGNNIFDKINQYINPDTSAEYINLLDSILNIWISLKLLGKIIWNFLTNHIDKLFDIIINSLSLCGV